jgi:hypothetical protein
MKIEKTAPVKTFQPISITITIESEEELNAFRDMTAFDQTIPELVGMGTSREHKTIENFLISVREMLYN